MNQAVEWARAAGLRYVGGADPGIRRRRAGEAFRYLHPDGRAVRDQATLARIRRLAIPPAWTEVWICTAADGHLQATGLDARGASSTATTHTGGRCATKRSTGA